MYLVDYHIHSRHSNDGNESVFNICRAAIEKGFSEVAITDHFDPCRNDEECIKSYHYDSAKRDIESVKQVLGGKIKILTGIEVGQAQEYTDSVRGVLENKFDYVIGSLHNISGDKDLARIVYSTDNVAEITDDYFNRLIQCAKLGLYDCIGHLDYPKRYAALYGIKFDYKDYFLFVDEILKTVIEKGKGIEINCSGLRQEINETLPSVPVIKRYRELGGEIITIGSDAHKLSDVGNKINAGYIIAAEAGFKYITMFKRRCPKFIKL